MKDGVYLSPFSIQCTHPNANIFITTILHTNFKEGLLGNYFLASRTVCETIICFQMLVFMTFC